MPGMDTQQRIWGNLGPPPVRPPVRSDEYRGALFGKRVILDGPEGYARDFRAVSDVQRSDILSPAVAVVDEAAYYRWLQDRRTPRPRGAVTWPASMVYVEP
jgi:hypothetical protein